MLATDIIRRVSTALYDNTNVRWAPSELVDYINDAQAQIIILRPDSNSVISSVQLTPGSKQAIPLTSGIDPNGIVTPPGVRFLRLTRNMGADGKTPGRAIRESSRVALDNELPDWHWTNPSTITQHYIFDNIAPKNFYVYPMVPSTTAVWVEMVYAAMAAPVLKDSTNNNNPTSATNQLTLGDFYINAVMDWVLYRCYGKDASYAGNSARAAQHLEGFGNTLQVSMQTLFTAAAAQQATPTPAAAAQARTGP